MVLVGGALRLMYLQLVVDDGGFVQKTGRARAASDSLGASMRTQSSAMRQYRRDMAIASTGTVVALGMVARAYAQVEEIATRTVFASGKMGDSVKAFRGAVRDSIRESTMLSRTMGVTVRHAQQLQLSIQEAGLHNTEAINAMSRSSIALARATGGAVSETEAFDSVYRLLRVTLREGEDIDQTAKAATAYASAIALAGNESAAGVGKVLAYINTLKDIELAVPIAREELIALAAAMADVNDRTKEMSRTAIIRLFTKGAIEDFGALSGAVMRNADPALLERFGVASQADLDALRQRSPTDFLFAVASAAKGLSTDIGPDGRPRSASIADITAMREQLNLANTRDLVTLSQLSAAQVKYDTILKEINKDQQRYIEQGEEGTALFRFHSYWLTTLTGQWEQGKAALSQMNTELNGTFSLLTALPALAGVSILQGVANSPLLSLGLAGAGAVFGVRRLRGIAGVRDAALMGSTGVAFPFGGLAGNLRRFSGGVAVLPEHRDLLKGASPTEIAAFYAARSMEARGDFREAHTRERNAARIAAQTAALRDPALLLPGPMMAGKGRMDLLALQGQYLREQRRVAQENAAALAYSTRVRSGLKIHENPSVLAALFGAHTMDLRDHSLTRQERAARLGGGVLNDLAFLAMMMPGGGMVSRGWGATKGFFRGRSAVGLEAFANTRTLARQSGASPFVTRFAPQGARTLGFLGLGGGSMGGLAAAGAIPAIGLLVAGLAALAPVARSFANNLTNIIQAEGPLSNVLRIVRLVFRTIELGGMAVQWIFSKLMAPIKWIAKTLGIPEFGSLDKLDEKMKGWSESMRPSTSSGEKTTAQERSAIVTGPTYITINNGGSKDATVGALRDAGFYARGVNPVVS